MPLANLLRSGVLLYVIRNRSGVPVRDISNIGDHVDRRAISRQLGPEWMTVLLPVRLASMTAGAAVGAR